MRFAHLADIHLGAWREPLLRKLSTNAFQKAIRMCISEKVDFILISGDLFNTSLPSIDILKTAVSELKRLKDNDIPVYTIAGSHDFSPSGKTMLDVLEEAELITDVFKGDVLEGRLNLGFTQDRKTGAKITGMPGKRGMLEKKNYEALIKTNLEEESGFKIFLFHTGLNELKPKELESMDSAPASILPAGFNYYAGGHIHIVKRASIKDYSNLVYPGPIFPNSFSEFEKLKHGGFYIYEKNNDKETLDFRPVALCPVISLDISCDNMSAEFAREKITKKIEDSEILDSIVLLRIHGLLSSGKTADLNMGSIIKTAEKKGAFFVLKNTTRLSSGSFEESCDEYTDSDDTEDKIINENLGKFTALGLDNDTEKRLILKIMHALDVSKDEGERQTDFEIRVVAGMDGIIDKVHPENEKRIEKEDKPRSSIEQ